MAAKVEDVFKLIKSQVDSQAAEDVQELVLDSVQFGKFSPEIKSELEKYKNLMSLSLNDCNLRSLDGFPSLPQLLKLEIIDNKLSANCLPQLLQLKELQSLSLGGNNFSSLEGIRPLTKLENLIDLDLLGCKICDNPNYRKEIYALFPNLIILDNCDKDGKEVDDEEDDDDDLDDNDDELDGDDDLDDDEEEYDDDDEEGDDDEDDEEEEEEDEDENSKARQIKKAKK